MPHSVTVTVDVKSPACDVRSFDFLENEYIDIKCEESYYASLWSRLKSDPTLTDQLKDIKSVPSTIVLWPGLKRETPQMAPASILGSIVMTIVVYAALAGIAYCVYVGAKTLLQ